MTPAILRVLEGTFFAWQGLYDLISFFSVVNAQEGSSMQPDSIFVKLPDNKMDCFIVSLDNTPDGRIFVADGFNKDVKSFDRRGQYLASCVFSSSRNGPKTMAVVDNTEALLAMKYEKKLYILDIEDIKSVKIRK